MIPPRRKLVLFGNFVFNNENKIKEIAKFIILSEKPFYLAQNPIFIRMLLCGLNPKFKLGWRNTIRKYCIFIYDECKHILILEYQCFFLNCSQNFKINFWNILHYLYVTPYYIDNTWTLQKCILSLLNRNTNLL